MKNTILLATLTALIFCAEAHAQGRACEAIKYSARYVGTSASRHLFKIKVVNTSGTAIALEKDRLTGTFTTETHHDGKWNLTKSTSVGRGVSSRGASSKSSNECGNRIVLDSGEAFSARAEVENELFLQDGELLSSLGTRRRRVTF